MKSTLILTLLIFFNLFSPAVRGQETAEVLESGGLVSDGYVTPTKTVIDLFASDEILDITLQFDVREFVRTKLQPAYMDALMTARLDEGDSVTQRVKIKARGEMRRTYCSFPPIMIKFKDKNGDIQSDRLLGKGTLKLVTHCKSSSEFESYIFKEYLTYQLYSLATPYSFRTRLVRINYRDTGKSGESFTEFGFLIENEEHMAKRNNAVIVENPNISQRHMDSTDMARLAVFNYMIGNTDWSVPLQHNIKVLKSLETFTDKGIPVAYDFDYSAVVNTVYSAPNEELPIKTVSERYFLGLCFKPEDLKPVINEFGELQGKFLDTINDFDYLSEGDKKQFQQYINSFYKRYKNTNVLINDMYRTCQQY